MPNDMTTGEMFAWTNRLKNILEVGGSLKNKRLQALSDDLERATDLVNDKYAKSLYMRVNEELSGFTKSA